MARRPTQIEAYRTIRDNGLLTARRMEVYHWLFHHGPANAGQVARALNRDRGATSCRCGELVEQTVVAEIGSRKCPRTRMEVIVYDVTDNLPVPFKPTPKSMTRKQLIARVEELEQEVARLKGEQLDLGV